MTTAAAPIPPRAPLVIVIGAGAAGLAAAQSLPDAAVVVLEARDHSGGRCYTEVFEDGSAVDMGAAWVHGATEKNPITALAEASNAKLVETDWDNCAAFGVGADSSAVLLLEEELDRTEALFERTFQLQENLQSLAHQEGTPDESLWQLLQRVKSKKFPGFANLGERERLLLLSRWKDETCSDYAASMHELSAKWWDNDNEIKGPHKLLQNGYSQVIEHLEEGLDIRFGSKVVGIKQNNTDTSVEVCLSSGESMFCAACICTLPLGVLKRGNITFEPELPQPKLVSIRRLGVGLMNKVALRFDKCFWNNAKATESEGEPASIVRIPLANERLVPEALEVPFFVNLRPATGSNVLVAYLVCDTARFAETQADSDLVLRTVKMLTAMMPEAATAKVLESKISRWDADEFACGSYSFVPVGASRHDRQELARPVGGSLFFAGEATVVDFPSTVHGAYLSGLRAAKEAELLLLLSGGGGGGGSGGGSKPD